MAIQSCVRERANHQTKRRDREEETVELLGDTHHANEHQRRPGDVREETAKAEGDDQRVSDGHGMAQHAAVVSERATKGERCAVTARRSLSEVARGEHEQHKSACGEHGVDRAPSAEGRDPRAERGGDHRREPGSEVDVRLPRSRFASGEEIADGGDHQHLGRARTNSHQQAPREQRTQRGRERAERAEHGVGRTPDEDDWTPAEPVRHRRDDERPKGEADHEDAHRERRGRGGDAKRLGCLREHRQAHVGGKRRQRHECGKQQGKAERMRIESGHVSAE